MTFKNISDNIFCKEEKGCTKYTLFVSLEREMMMKKDFSKICIRTILTYFVIILMICLLRIFDVNIFGIKYDNNLLNVFSDFVGKYKLENIWYSITLYIYTYMILSISCKDNSKKMRNYAFVVTLIGIPFKFLTNTTSNLFLKGILEIIFLIIPPIIYNKKIKKSFINTLIYIFINTLFQMSALYCKNIDYVNNVFIMNIMLDIDYIIIQLLFYYYYFNREEVRELWEMVVGLFLDLWHGFTQLLVLFLESLKHLIYGLKNHKNTIKKVLKLKKKERIDNIVFLSIYYLLTLFWNVFTIVLVIIVAKINNMTITIIFVIFSFLFNKGKFGKPLHLKSAFYCFIISNVSYYFISRLTLPIGTSYLVPILIGVLMSYYTSLIVKYTTKELYKGMKEDELRSICEVKHIEKYKVDLLVDYYCNKMNYVQLHIKYRYSIDRLRHMKMEYAKEFKNR